MPRMLLGILTLYLNNAGLLEERKVYEHMTIEGAKLDIQVVVFTPSPNDLDYSEKRVKAHVYSAKSKKWLRKWIPIPKLVFDRCRIQKTHRMNELRTFKQLFPDIRYMNRPFSNKWVMHQKLLTSPFIRNYLPDTIKYSQKKDLQDMLKKYNIVYAKPINGTGGRGILRIVRHSSYIVKIEGRNHNRKIITPRVISISTLRAFMKTWNVTSTPYLVQQGIPLTLDNGRVHDYRILVQKDGNGQWSFTGGAGRIGAARSITANLHGGGSAVVMEKLIQQFVDPSVPVDRVQEEIKQLSIELAHFLEALGYTLCEIAIDIAIDKSGKIWIIELNPKPAREVFREIGENEKYLEAIRKPLEYAQYLNSYDK